MSDDRTGPSTAPSDGSAGSTVATPRIVPGGTDVGQPGPPRSPAEPSARARPVNPGDEIDRGTVISAAARSVGRWAWSLVGIMLATAAIFWLLWRLQVGLIPIMLAIIICTVLNPLKNALQKIKVPGGLASAIVLVAAVALVVGLLASVAPGIVDQISAVISSAGVGLQQLTRWLEGPPLNIDNEQLQEVTAQVTSWLQGQAANIASGFVSGITTIGSVLVTLFLVLVLTFFFLKDGAHFLPAVRHIAGRRAGQHLSEVLSRIWHTLGAFIRTQAVVGAIDGLFIGLGLVFLDVPLALALAILTFLFSFIPTLGAIIAGALAVLVALVSNGFTSAIWVLILVLAVQQLESNIVFPVLQRRSVDVHPALSLVSVAIGGTSFGIIGAFLAVPVVATALVVLRYISEQIDVISGERDPTDIRVVTADGALATAATAQFSRLFRRHPPDPEFAAQPDQAVAATRQPAPRERLGQLARRLRRRTPEPDSPADESTDESPDEPSPRTRGSE